MDKNSPYRELKWRVDCCPPDQHFYQTIAAFNVDTVAIEYATSCYTPKRVVQPGWHYRVMERRGNRWVEIWNHKEGLVAA